MDRCVSEALTQQRLLTTAQRRKLHFGRVLRARNTYTKMLEQRVDGRKGGKPKRRWRDDIKDWSRRTVAECSLLARDRQCRALVMEWSPTFSNEDKQAQAKQHDSPTDRSLAILVWTRSECGLDPPLWQIGYVITIVAGKYTWLWIRVIECITLMALDIGLQCHTVVERRLGMAVVWGWVRDTAA